MTSFEHSIVIPLDPWSLVRRSILAPLPLLLETQINCKIIDNLKVERGQTLSPRGHQALTPARLSAGVDNAATTITALFVTAPYNATINEW